MSEKRLIAFRTLQNACCYQLYSDGYSKSKYQCSHHIGFYGMDCCVKNCPIFKRLRKPGIEYVIGPSGLEARAKGEK